MCDRDRERKGKRAREREREREREKEREKEKEREENKAVYTAISVACGWAGAVMSVCKPRNSKVNYWRNCK